MKGRRSELATPASNEVTFSLEGGAAVTAGRAGRTIVRIAMHVSNASPGSAYPIAPA